MGARATKAKDNVFYKVRLEASRYNDRLLSRAGAAEALGYASESTISDWELGISIPTPEAVLKMADLYNAPELINTYCHNMCPLGGDVPEITAMDLDRISIKAISESERPELEEVIATLDEVNSITQELKTWVSKNLQKR